jgi:hypothetical protein
MPPHAPVRSLLPTISLPVLGMLTNIKGFKGYVHFDPCIRRVGGVRRLPWIHQNRSESSAKNTHKIIVDKDDGMIICSRNRAEWGRNVFGGSYFETFHS